MFINDNDLNARLDILLKPKDGNVVRPAWWPQAVTDSNSSAYQTIVSALAVRGFSPAIITAWVRGAEYQIDIGLYYLGLKGSVNEAYDTKDLPKTNRSAELCDVPVCDVSGNLLSPDVF